MSEHVHTFPVPPGWTDDEAWEWICQGLTLPTTEEPDHWCNYVCDGEECRRAQGWAEVIAESTEDRNILLEMMTGALLPHPSGECRTCFPGFNIQGTSMCLDNIIGQAQSQPRSLPGRFGREEGLKDLVFY